MSGILPGMDAIEAILEEEPKRDSRGRKVLGAAERERLITEYESCGLTQREFCRREGVNYHTFVAWLGRHRSKHAKVADGRMAFVEAVVPFGQPGSGVERSPGACAAFELDLGGGLVVRTGDEAALVRLISRLRG